MSKETNLTEKQRLDRLREALYCFDRAHYEFSRGVEAFRDGAVVYRSVAKKMDAICGYISTCKAVLADEFPGINIRPGKSAFLPDGKTNGLEHTK